METHVIDFLKETDPDYKRGVPESGGGGGGGRRGRAVGIGCNY